MERLVKWHQTKVGLAAFGAVELSLAYGFANLAIDRGTLWWYLLALLFLIGALQNFAKLIRKIFHGNQRGSTR